MKCDYNAEIEISAELPLDEMAKHLTDIFNVVFLEDVEGRFDEVPAYIAIVGNIELVLFGSVEGVLSDYYFFQISTDDEIDLSDYTKDHLSDELFSCLLQSKALVDEYGCQNVSNDFLKFIAKKTGINCRIAQ